MRSLLLNVHVSQGIDGPPGNDGVPGDQVHSSGDTALSLQIRLLYIS